MSKIKPIIIAGGSGTRLWPISRKSSPKQVKPFVDEETLLRKTYNRLSRVVGFENIHVSIGSNLIDVVHEQLGDVPLIVEPELKDTAAAVGYVCVRLLKEDPDTILTTVWSDHYIENEKEYAEVFDVAEEFLSSHPESIFMAGVKPMYPETGYGYIEMGNIEGVHLGRDVHHVRSFKEKPDLATAEKYVEKWEYLWNPAMFFFKASYMLELLKSYEPEMYKGLMRIYEALGTDKEMEVVEREFSMFKKISIDLAVMERASNLFVLPVDIGWTDVGHWKAIYDILADGDENIVKNAEYVEIDSKRNLIFSETNQLISTVGVSDSLVIVSEDAILIASKDRAQDVKRIVSHLQEKDFKKFT